MDDWRRTWRDVAGASGASALATTLDGLLYAILVATWVERGVVGVGVAAGLGAVLGGVVHWSLSRFWVFRRFEAPVARSAVGYFAMSWLAALFHGLLTQWGSARLGNAVAWFVSKGIVWVAWTYPASRYLIFGGVGSGREE